MQRPAVVRVTAGRDFGNVCSVHSGRRNENGRTVGGRWGEFRLDFGAQGRRIVRNPQSPETLLYRLTVHNSCDNICDASLCALQEPVEAGP